MKNYEVRIKEPALFTYLIEAENEELAKKIAMDIHCEKDEDIQPEFELPKLASIHDIVECEENHID